jgi:hypothetical protein
MRDDILKQLQEYLNNSQPKQNKSWMYFLLQDFMWVVECVYAWNVKRKIVVELIVRI